ncbi:MAG: hypothetical protein IKH29_06095 [Methanobrevibacter sp.]|uniref:hypothetical protein n=1 Tax=Methanobrevibacter sp. TaxID=66852 RepID=UPI0026010FBF|nr:hypothetical protein [Methanobrevibacter sp.]MBR3113271.1 hypothetical protein [Methanobrevibacter sp.]MBR6993415.1 hypothetical protein [Methanobrevibacter sp.]
MDNKNIIMILVAVVAIIAIVGAIFVSGMFNGAKETATTPFETEFMDGVFAGNVTLKDGKQKFMHSYVDKEHKITYNISTVDNSTALMDIYSVQGVTNPEERSFNGNDWNIYFTEAIPGNDSSAKDNNTMNIIICQSQGKKQGYLIYMIVDSKSDINSTGNEFGQAYKDFAQPLLESITLKESKNVPKINEEFGLSEDQFAEQMDLIQQIKAGNTSALEGVQ